MKHLTKQQESDKHRREGEANMPKQTIYRELKCGGCKRMFMVNTVEYSNPNTVKRCPHCLGKNVRPTGSLGISVSKDEITGAAQALEDARPTGGDRT